MSKKIQERPKIFFFWGVAIMFLISMLFLASNAGVSGDEKVHHEHALDVIQFYKTLGKDTTCLHTPKTHLQYYGQSVDNLAALIIEITGSKATYEVRHVVCVFFAWLGIIMAGLIAAHLMGWGWGVLAMFLLVLIPSYLGHCYNNLKDIPFASAYTWGIYALMRLLKEWPNPARSTYAHWILAVGLAIGIRIGGGLLIAFLGVFLLIHLFQNRDTLIWGKMASPLVKMGMATLGGYFLGLLFWPYGLINPIKNPYKSLQVMELFTTSLRQLFEGQLFWSEDLPWYYVVKYMLMTIPEFIWLGILVAIFFGTLGYRKWNLRESLVWFGWLFPIVYVIVIDANLYGGWRHLLFVGPCLVVASVSGFHSLFTFFKKRSYRWCFALLMASLSLHPLIHIIRNHPVEYVYYNFSSGGIKKAWGNYELDYYFHSMKPASDWVKERIPEEPVIVASNFDVAYYFRDYPNVKTIYVPFKYRHFQKWDYGVFCNEYIDPRLLKTNLFPPPGTVHTICVDEVPVAIAEKPIGQMAVRGLQLYKKGDYLKAEEAFRSAALADSTEEQYTIWQARALWRDGEVKRALAILENSEKRGLAGSDTWLLKSVLLGECGQWEAARKEAVKVLKKNRKNASAWRQMARSSKALGDSLKAKRYEEFYKKYKGK